MKKFRDFIAYNCFMICIAIAGGLGIFIFYGCKKDEDKSKPNEAGLGVWVQKADLGDIDTLCSDTTLSICPDTLIISIDTTTTPRSSAVGFSIGSKGYIGTGQYFISGTLVNYKDFWEYDPGANLWTQKADFGGSARYAAVGFSIGSKGYIGTGSGNDKDFWEYDTTSNTWTKKADFGGTARYYAVGFSIGSIGYIGTGWNNSYLKDFWEYDPNTDTWTKKADFGGIARAKAVGFSIGSKGYVGTGYDGNNPLKDFWEYDPGTDLWTKKDDFESTARLGAVGFSIGSKGYIGTGGEIGGASKKDFWEYDPAADIIGGTPWTKKTNFGGTARSSPVGFSIGSKGYIGTGSRSDGTFIKDFWEYTP
ncbi:MAG: galactose oxidase [Cytophagales bacterium]|nr:galactose oxidase [Cytophagales bacterium]